MRSTLTSSLMFAAVLLWMGCAATHPVHYYTIRPAIQPANPDREDGLTLLVGEVATPADMQDGRIRYRIGPNEIGAYQYHRWAERPGSIVRTSLERALRDSGRYQRVLDTGSSVPGDYLVRGKLNEFGEVDNASVRTRISLDVELVDKKTNRTVWDLLVEREEPVGNKDVANVVQSLDRNLQGVVSEMVAGIDKFLATPR